MEQQNYLFASGVLSIIMTLWIHNGQYSLDDGYLNNNNLLNTYILMMITSFMLMLCSFLYFLFKDLTQINTGLITFWISIILFISGIFIWIYETIPLNFYYNLLNINLIIFIILIILIILLNIIIKKPTNKDK